MSRVPSASEPVRSPPTRERLIRAVLQEIEVSCALGTLARDELILNRLDAVPEYALQATLHMLLRDQRIHRALVRHLDPVHGERNADLAERAARVRARARTDA